MDILDDMGVSKLSVKVFLKVNYSFKYPILRHLYVCNCNEEKKWIEYCEWKAFVPCGNVLASGSMQVKPWVEVYCCLQASCGTRIVLFRKWFFLLWDKMRRWLIPVVLLSAVTVDVLCVSVTVTDTNPALSLASESVWLCTWDETMSQVECEKNNCCRISGKMPLHREVVMWVWATKGC